MLLVWFCSTESTFSCISVNCSRRWSETSLKFIPAADKSGHRSTHLRHKVTVGQQKPEQATTETTFKKHQIRSWLRSKNLHVVFSSSASLHFLSWRLWFFFELNWSPWSCFIIYRWTSGNEESVTMCIRRSPRRLACLQQQKPTVVSFDAASWMKGHSNWLPLQTLYRSRQWQWAER